MALMRLASTPSLPKTPIAPCVVLDHFAPHFHSRTIKILTSCDRARKITGEITETNVDEVVEWLTSAKNVIIVPGYGLAVAKAQYAVAEFTYVLSPSPSSFLASI